ncbi:hypothetical protein ACHQM5_021012 [Ranunculus cassubicifolius]
MNSDPFPSPYLKRRNSMDSPLLPTNLHIPNKLKTSSFHLFDQSSFPTIDLELISLKSSPYTSLKDLLPSLSAIQSPTGGSCSQSLYEIPIRNHLVKQAAWAYLQPMSSSPNGSNQYSFRSMWVRFSTEYVKNPVNVFLGFLRRKVIPTITRVFDRILGAIRIRISTTTR